MIELEMQDRMELVREAQNVVKSRYLLCILVTQPNFCDSTLFIMRITIVIKSNKHC